MTSLLEIEGVDAYYGAAQALFGMSLSIGKAEAVALLGRNGMGKTTTVRAVLGILRARSGALSFAGHDIARKPSYRIARLGIGYVPEGRLVFPTLTVWENLVATRANYGERADPWTCARVYDLFPRLAERERSFASNLSGGEQQMLAIGRALMLNPRLLILDEATEGLAPLIRAAIVTALSRLRTDGLAMLLIDKNLAEMRTLVDRVVVMEKGSAVWHGTAGQLLADASRRQQLLGV